MTTKKALRFISFLLPVFLFPSERTNAQDIQTAISLTRSEQFNEAGALFRSLIQKDPSDGTTYFYYGDNYLQKYYSDPQNSSYKSLVDSAGRIFKAGISSDSLNPLNYVGLGRINLINQQKEMAEVTFRKAISLLPSKTNKTSRISKKEQAVVYIKVADSYVKILGKKDTAMVFDMLRKAESLDDRNFELYLTRGDAYFYMVNEGSMAIENYKIAQSMNPASCLAKLRIGHVWIRARLYDNALGYFKEATQIDSNYAPAYRAMGFLLVKLNRNEEAKKNFQKFLALSKGNVSARIQYINTLMELQDYKEAIIQLNSIRKVDSANNDYNRALAYAYYETAQYGPALQSIRKFIDHADSASVRTADQLYFGRILSKNNLDSLAAEELLTAYSMDTAQTAVLSEIAFSYTRSKKYEKAEKVFLMKINRNRAEPFDYYSLGKLYYNMHEYRKADSVLAYFNEIQPDYIQGYLWRAWSLVNIDSDSKLGLAKPVFETIIEKAHSDSTKYTKELKEAYSYLAFYYLLQYYQSKDQKDGVLSMDFCQKVMAIDPSDEKAKAILKELKGRIIK